MGTTRSLAMKGDETSGSNQREEETSRPNERV